MKVFVLCEQPFRFDQGDEIENYVEGVYYKSEDAIKEAESRLEGDSEIKVTKEGNTWIIGFADDDDIETRYSVKELELNQGD